MSGRAKISDRTARGAPTYNAWTGQMVEQSDREEMLDVEAEREARAILAETEPIGRGLFTAFVPVCGLDAVADLGAPMALAESLRSFVEA